MRTRLFLTIMLAFSAVSKAQLPSTLAEVIAINLPVVEINTLDNEEPTYEKIDAPEGFNGKGITNATKVPGRVNIYVGGEIIYSSGEYEAGVSGMTVKVRGNTSARQQKKPYKIKLQKKADLLCRGESKFKDKDWFLLATGNVLKSAIGMKVNELLGMPWTPSYEYVSLVFNGDYRGTYILCESIKRNPDCRIDVDKNSGYLFEYDAYWWNEDVSIRVPNTSKFGFTFKYPDCEDITPEQLDYMTKLLNTIYTSLSDGHFTNYLDMHSFSRWMLGHDILGTKDYAGSNMYLSKYDDNDSSKVCMPCMWDFDTIFQMTDDYARIHNMGGAFYMKKLFDSPNPDFRVAYYRLWRQINDEYLFERMADFLSKLNSSSLSIALDEAFRLDAIRWGKSYSSVQSQVDEALSWFKNRQEWLSAQISKDYFNVEDSVYGEKATDLVINEVMQSNIDYLMEDNDFPDSWVELYNPTSKNISLMNWGIGQSSDASTAYIFTKNVQVPANGFVLVYCDKVSKGMHTDFRIDSDKSALYLFDPSMKIVDSLKLKKMPNPNIAYGRIKDGHGDWQYEVTPTAGEKNNSIGANKVLPDPIFSMQGGVMTAPVTFTVSMPEAEVPSDTKLYVTTDGSEPTLNSWHGDSLCFEIDTTTVIRAKLISSYALASRSVTQSFIYHPRETKLPIISLVTDDKWLYDEELGMLSEKTNPGNSKPNYKLDYRRPINAEYFDLRNGENYTMFNQLGETAISGNASRENKQRSLKLYANKRFGTKRYKGSFWTDKPEVNEVKSFTLRNGGNDCWYARITDAFVQTIFGTHLATLDWQAYQPVIVYVNGVYKGEYGMRERNNEDYVESNYNGLEDIENVNQTAYHNYSKNTPLFNDFHTAYNSHETTYSEMANMMDMNNFRDVLIAEMYANNYDYPHNNISIWRPTSDDGKWRWILKDTDYFHQPSYGNWDIFKYMFLTAEEGSQEYKRIHLTNNSEKSHNLYVGMMNFPEFREQFIDHFSVYLGDFLKTDCTNHLIDSLRNDIIDEIVPTYKAYGNESTLKSFNTNVDRVKSISKNRPKKLYQQMSEFFDLGNVIPMKIITNGQDVLVNGVGLTEGDFDGSYFADRILNINSGSEGYNWKLTITHKDSTTNEIEFGDSEADILLREYYSNPEDSISVCFETVLDESQETFITSTTMVDEHKNDVYSLVGIKLATPTKGVNIIKRRDGSVKKLLKK